MQKQQQKPVSSQQMMNDENKIQQLSSSNQIDPNIQQKMIVEMANKLDQNTRLQLDCFNKACQSQYLGQIKFGKLPYKICEIFIIEFWKQRRSKSKNNIVHLTIDEPEITQKYTMDQWIKMFSLYPTIKLQIAGQKIDKSQGVVYQDQQSFCEGVKMKLKGKELQQYLKSVGRQDQISNIQQEEIFSLNIFDKKTNQHYFGRAIQVQNKFIKHGYGILFANKAKKSQHIRYQGNFRNGERWGYGIQTIGRHTQYCGQWTHNCKNGEGVYIKKSKKKSSQHPGYKYVQKQKYEGNFYQDEKKGQGVQWTKDGTYKGEFLHGFKHGKGKINYSNGSSYEGDWDNGVIHGQGVYIQDVSAEHGLQKGSKFSQYQGELKNGQYNGQGIMKYANGDQYNGQWQNGKRHGKGMYTWGNGDYYDGEWNKNMAQGKAQCMQGQIFYSGQYFLGVKNGLGQQTNTEQGNTVKGIWQKNRIVRKIMINDEEVPEDQQKVSYND